MCRILALAVVALALLSGTIEAQTQERVTDASGASVVQNIPSIATTSGIDYYTPMFSNGYVDVEPLAPTPCGPSRVLKSATPIVYDGTLMVLYVCTNAGTFENPGQTTIWRRYFRPGNQDAVKPIPVYMANPVTGAPSSSPAPVLGQAYPGPVLYLSCDAGHVRVGAACVPR